jgi:hypothetical protein
MNFQQRFPISKGEIRRRQPIVSKWATSPSGALDIIFGKISLAEIKPEVLSLWIVMDWDNSFYILTILERAISSKEKDYASETRDVVGYAFRFYCCPWSKHRD